MANNVLAVRHILCNDITANWDVSTKVLLRGELACEFRLEGAPKFKIGDGVKTWDELEYITLTPAETNSLIANLQNQIGNLASINLPSTDRTDLVTAINALITHLGTLDTAVSDINDNIDDIEDRLDAIEADTSKEIYMTRTVNSSTLDVTYTLYQGDSEIPKKPDTQDATYVSQITIARDMVLDSVTIEHYEAGDELPEGVTEPGTYIKFVFVGIHDPLYLNATSLVDIYTAARNATEVQITIDANKVVSAALVNKGITKEKLRDDVYERLYDSVNDIVVSGTNSTVTASTYTDTVTIDGTAVTVSKKRFTISTISTDILRNGANTLVLNGGNYE